MRLNTSLYKLVFHQLISYKFYYLLAFACLVATHYTQSALPFLAKDLADFISYGKTGLKTWVFFALALGIIIFRTSSRLLFFTPARIMERDLRSGLMAKLEEAVPFRYKKMAPGQVFQVVYNDTEQMRTLVGFALLQVGNIVIAAGILVPKLAAFNVKLIMALIPMVVSSLIFTLVVAFTRKYFRLGMEYQGELQNYIMESYKGKKTIKNYHREASFIGLFKEHSWRELNALYKGGVLLSFSTPIVPLGVGLSLVWGGHLIKMQGLDANVIILFSGFIFLFLEPLMFLSWIGVVFVSSQVSWKRVRDLADGLERVSPQEAYLLKVNPPGELTDGLGRGPFSLTVDFWKKSLSLFIPQKKWTTFIGRTGHGKTYLLEQMAFLYKQQGRNISYVAQNPYLFNDTFYKNIFMGREVNAADLALAENLTELFGLAYLAEDFNQLLQLEVGENGKKLSGGQGKRVCLIRSLLCRSDIFIWDDPFSSLDIVLEKQIVTELKNHPLLRNKTMILSTHRISSAKNCDEIIFIEKSQGIIEQGPVSTLLFLNEKESKTYEYFKDQMV